MSRPTKLTPVIQKKICEFLKQGHFLKTAAALANVSERTLYSWLAQGRKEDIRIAGGKDANPAAAEYLKFYIGIEKASSHSEHMALKRLKSDMAHNVKSVEFFLTHRFPETWGGKPELDKKVLEFKKIMEEMEAEDREEEDKEAEDREEEDNGEY